MSERDLQGVLAALTHDRSLVAMAPCGHTYLLNDGPLFYGDQIPDAARPSVDRLLAELAAQKKDLEKLTAKIDSTEEKSVAIQFGKTVEKIVPVLSGFPYSPQDCRPLFDPIDYIVFHGWSTGKVQRVEFIDVKSGNANLTGVQVRIRDIVLQGRVSIEGLR